jgi:hypothetical protein
MHRLAPVELQLCAQFLDARSLLNLAQCSKRLLADCSFAFAWQHAPPVTVSTESANLPVAGRGLAGPLLRHASVCLRCNSALPSPEDVHELPRVDELVMEGQAMQQASPEDLEQIIRAPPMETLRELRACAGVTLPSCVASLPQLRTLHLPGVSTEVLLSLPAAVSASASSASASASASASSSPSAAAAGGDDDGAAVIDAQPLSSLTELSFHCGGALTSECFEVVSRRTRLQRLELIISGSALRVSDFVTLFTSGPNLSDLRELTVRQLTMYALSAATGAASGSSSGGALGLGVVGDDLLEPLSSLQPSEQWACIFDALPLLEVLTLDRLQGINAVLPSLGHAASLKHVQLCATRPSGFGIDMDSVPHAATIAAAMQARPALQWQLCIYVHSATLLKNIPPLPSGLEDYDLIPGLELTVAMYPTPV